METREWQPTVWWPYTQSADCLCGVQSPLRGTNFAVRQDRPSEPLSPPQVSCKRPQMRPILVLLQLRLTVLLQLS